MLRRIRYGTTLAALLLAGCGASHSSSSGVTAAQLNGVYNMQVSAASVAKHDRVPVSQALAENYGKFILVVRNGHFALTQQNPKACTWQYGRLRVKGDRMDWFFTDGGGQAPDNAENKPGEHFVWTTSLYRGTLSLRPVTPTDLTRQVWHKVGGRPTIGALIAACRPPLTSLSG